mgnify:FL=1|tara:strand:- start:939 stop:1187 length:249 start_codon:yes stop_codon:yes gene_type:complete
MAWVEVTVKAGKEEVPALFNGMQVDLPSHIKVGESIKLNDVDYKVINTIPDSRDEITHVILANAKDKGGKSDDEPVEGPNED